MELENRHGAGNKKESRIIYSHTIINVRSDDDTKYEERHL